MQHNFIENFPVYNVVNDFDEGDELTVLKNQGIGL